MPSSNSTGVLSRSIRVFFLFFGAPFISLGWSGGHLVLRRSCCMSHSPSNSIWLSLPCEGVLPRRRFEILWFEEVYCSVFAFLFLLNCVCLDVSSSRTRVFKGIETGVVVCRVVCLDTRDGSR